MTKPTVTHQQKFLSDLTALTEIWEGSSGTWTEGNLQNCAGGDITPTISHDDILQIQLDTDDGTGTIEGGAYSFPDEGGANPLVDLDFSTTLYPSFLVRYKTSETELGAHAKVVLVFDDATTQTILDDAYSTKWTTATGDIFTGKTLDHIRLYAECDLDTPNDTYYVYYDFVMIHKDTFEFPFVAPGGVTLHLPKKVAQLSIPGRDGDILQNLGMASPRIHLEGNMDTNVAWGTPKGEYLYRILRGAIGDYHDPWQWFTSEVGNFKVTLAPEGLKIGMVDEKGVVRKYSLDFLVHSLSSLGEADWDELEWAGQ